MSTSYKKILAEVKAQSDPQRKTVLNQISSLPEQQIAQESSLAAQKDQAYADILGGARQRGLGFSGIPLGEQAKYNATQYAPAVANLKSSFNDRRSQLESILAGIGSQDYINARSIYEADRGFAEQQRQFNESLAAQRSYSGGGAGAGAGAGAGDYLDPSDNSTAPKINYSKKSGYQFTDAYGSPINAAEYVQLANRAGINIGYRELLSQMAKQGDSNAKIALKYVGNDAQFGNAPSIYRGALEALGASGSYSNNRGGGGGGV